MKFYLFNAIYFQQLCDIVCDLLLEESNIQPVSTPVTVCGDIHGQVFNYTKFKLSNMTILILVRWCAKQYLQGLHVSINSYHQQLVSTLRDKSTSFDTTCDELPYVQNELYIHFGPKIYNYLSKPVNKLSCLSCKSKIKK